MLRSKTGARWSVQWQEKEGIMGKVGLFWMSAAFWCRVSS